MAVAAGSYVYDQSWTEEHKRLGGMEALLDPGTKRVIDSLGIAPGWRCLEVGAGAGSIAHWMGERVGPEGAVLATDVSTRHLTHLDAPNIEVREHDILSDALPDGEFDLVHARLLVEHLGRPALERMIPPVRPGGWLVLEDYDTPGAAVYPDDAGAQAVIDAVLDFMSRSGFDPELGRKLTHELERAGLEEVGAEGSVPVYRGGTPATDFLRLSIESLSDATVEAGVLTRDEIEAGLAGLADPHTTLLHATLVAAWGRKPKN
jgi:SAM-dependent methyltransferase